MERKTAPHIQRNIYEPNCRFLCRNLERKETMGWCIQNMERKKKAFQPGLLDLAKVSFTDEREIKTFIDKKKKEKKAFITARPALQEVLKGILQIEMKGH